MGQLDLKSLTHIIVSQDANVIVENLGDKSSKPTPFKVKGDHVHKTFQQPGDTKVLAICSKNTCLQLWDVNKKAEMWHAKNLPNDSLDLQIPVWDTGLAFITDRVMATSTAYGEVRHYDYRASMKVTSSNKVFKNSEMFLSHIIKSELNDNLLYVIN